MKPMHFIPGNPGKITLNNIIAFREPQEVANAICDTNKQIVASLSQIVQMVELEAKAKHRQQIIHAVPNPQGFLKQ